jgi:hypothetical protein
MHIPKKLVLVSVLVLAAVTASAHQKHFRVVATTSWTAAFAMAAGATDIMARRESI